MFSLRVTGVWRLVCLVSSTDVVIFSYLYDDDCDSFPCCLVSYALEVFFRLDTNCRGCALLAAIMPGADHQNLN